MTVIYAVLIFCLLIFVHEFGHFIVAKSCGIKVNAFALGMGPAIIEKQYGETKYSLRLFPIGGYCAMEGEDEDSEEPRAFNNKPAWQRACVLAAGSVMNLLTCILLLVVIAFWAGTATTTISEVQAGSPAEKAGIVAGDRIISIDGQEIDEWNDIVGGIDSGKDNKNQILVDRDGKTLSFSVISQYDKEAERNMIGIRPTSEHNFGKSIVAGVRNTGTMTVLMYKILKQLFTGEVSINELSGPVGIVYATNQAAKSGLIYVAYLAALLSLNLAIINMLPLPALDGGRLLFLVIRLFTGKRITEEVEGRIHFVGICLLFALMIYITFNDVIKFVLPIF